MGFSKNDPRISRLGRGKTSQPEVINFIRANSAVMSDSELSGAINARFNLNTSRISVKALRRYYKIIKGRDKWKPCPALTERTDSKGYVIIKNAEGKWMGKHKFLYEQANGKTPEGHIIIFLDGKHDNFSLDNLTPITKAESAGLAALGLRFDNTAATQTGIAIVRHKNKIMARKRDYMGGGV